MHTLVLQAVQILFLAVLVNIIGQGGVWLRHWDIKLRLMALEQGHGFLTLEHALKGSQDGWQLA